MPNSMSYCFSSEKAGDNKSWLLAVILATCNGWRLNPYKPDVLFVGHRQTVQTQIRRHKTWRLIRVSNVFLQKVLLKFELK